MWRRWVPRGAEEGFADGCPLNDWGGRRACCDRENEDGFDEEFAEVEGFDVVAGSAAVVVVVVVVIACETAGGGCGATVGEEAEAGAGAGAEDCGAVVEGDVADE